MSRHRDDPGVKDMKWRGRKAKGGCIYIQCAALPLNDKQPSVLQKKEQSESITGMSYERRLLLFCFFVFFFLNCTVFVLSGGEGSMIIVCSALDVPRTNCNSFVSLCLRELHGGREQFVNVCEEISVTPTMKIEISQYPASLLVLALTFMSCSLGND